MGRRRVQCACAIGIGRQDGHRQTRDGCEVAQVSLVAQAQTLDWPKSLRALPQHCRLRGLWPCVADRFADRFAAPCSFAQGKPAHACSMNRM